jgi:tight adherence protein C
MVQFMVAAGLFILVLGIGAAVRVGPTPQQRRILAASQTSEIIRPSDNDPTGVLRLFVPSSGNERTKIALRLRQGGMHAQNAVRTFFLVRMAFALILPSIFIGLAWFDHLLPRAIAPLIDPLSTLETAQIFLFSVFLIVVGYYGPLFWLNNKVNNRRKIIERGMPGALDLMQIAIEAGLGFDAAMNRVAHELGRFCQPIADEFTIVQLEIQAGKSRDRAFAELERRSGVEAMASFANVIQQATEFGTPVSEALKTYAVEMRTDRELKAQTKANQLPVKMSGVLAGFMMPALLLIMLTPVAIRWMTVM